MGNWEGSERDHGRGTGRRGVVGGCGRGRGEGEHRGTGKIFGNSGSGRVGQGRMLACWKLDGRQGDLRGGGGGGGGGVNAGRNWGIRGVGN